MAAAPSTLRTLVIIPAKDEEASLPRVLAELRRTAPGLDVVVVDDGSTDGTARVARQGGAVVLSLPFNLGIGGALRAGFRYAVRYGYDRGLQLDGDGQHDPAQIPTLLAALDDGADMVVGNRFGGQSQSYQLGRVRARAMAFMRFLVREFSGKAFTDTSSGFRAFNRDVLAFFARDYPAEYLESVEALLLACGAGFRVDEVPVRMHNRAHGAPSHRRFTLLFHYLRLLLVITVSVSRRRRTGLPGGPAPRGAPAGPGGVDSFDDVDGGVTTGLATAPPRLAAAPPHAGDAVTEPAPAALALDGGDP
jgi:glycosyltransferase involved in cell wall biosynthesis